MPDASPRILRWEALTKRDFDAIDRDRAVVLVTCSGAPAGASAELGEHILDTLGGHAALACSELLDGEIGPEDCHSPIWRLRFLFLNPWMIRISNRLLGFRNAIA